MNTSRADIVTDRLDRAAAACAREGGRLTDIRRLVLGLILDAQEPVGAYALLDRLKAERANATPVTVYRALGFLQEHGLVHKVERLNAFVGCTDEGEHHHHDHAVQFLICRDCRAVTEMEDDGIAAAVRQAARRSGFAPTRATVEVEGLCDKCQERPGALPLNPTKGNAFGNRY